MTSPKSPSLSGSEGSSIALGTSASVVSNESSDVNLCITQKTLTDGARDEIVDGWMTSYFQSHRNQIEMIVGIWLEN